MSYARSVAFAVPEIMAEAGLKRDSELEDKLVFVAGLRKLYAFCNSNLKILDSSLRSLRKAATPRVRIGSSLYSGNSADSNELQRLLRLLRELLAEEDLLEYAESGSFADIARQLSSGR